MLTFVMGGAGSGKSAYAESLLAASPGPRYYLATMQVWDEECRRRVERHRALRAGKGFLTLERPLDLAGLLLPEPGALLLEDLTNLAANERYDPNGAGPRTPETVYAGLQALHRQTTHLIVVGNELFCGGTDYEGDTLSYLRMLGKIHRRLATLADNVCEVTAGYPVYYKGKEPSEYACV